ncbi:MAG: hypothetical protein K2M56_09300 [Muribaculaceae bacterium]|nr:hypothetical protein [Bacteroidales bacterium]MDE6235931.1 hypothetical protein [Muribaculaceae bacterium]
MKKLMTLALCVATVGTMSAQKENVDAAKKLSGKPDKIEDARNLIKQAIADPSTANDALTYYTAGKIEFDAFDKQFQSAMINPESVDKAKMAEELLNGYNYFLQAVPLDQVPNAKGEVKPKYTKDIVNKLAGHSIDYFNGGGAMWEAKRFYPEAYQCFMIYADMPDMELLGKSAPKTAPGDRAQSYFNAGLAAYSGNSLDEAAAAFHKSQEYGFDDPNAYIYELACWQNIAMNDSTRQNLAQDKIYATAKAGFDKYGMDQPVFLNNLVNTYVMEEKYDDALNTVNSIMSSNPNNPNLLGLRAFVYDRAGKDAESLADYQAAAAIDTCDYETLVNAAKKMYRVAANRLGNLDPRDQAGKQEIRATLFEPGLAIANRAKQLNPQDSYDVDTVIDSYNYAIETYYPAR